MIVTYDKFESRMMNLLHSGRFNDEQKRTIISSMELGLDDKEIRVFLRENFNPEQMKRCIYGFMNGLSIEDVEKYAKECYSIEEMDQIRYSLIKENERNTAAYLIKEDFNESQMLEIRKGSDLPEMYIELYAMPYYTAEQMKEIRLGFQHGLSLKHISCYCDSRFSERKMCMIRMGFENGVSIEETLDFAYPDLPEESIYKAIKKAKQAKRKKCRNLELSI